jgi:hypothetical protein
MTKFHGWAELGEVPLHLTDETIKAKAFSKGPCQVLITQELHGKKMRWHMSISCHNRNPLWDEIKDARYALLPSGLWFAHMLPPLNEYINIHPHCFHLWEIDSESW